MAQNKKKKFRQFLIVDAEREEYERVSEETIAENIRWMIEDGSAIEDLEIFELQDAEIIIKDIQVIWKEN